MPRNNKRKDQAKRKQIWCPPIYCCFSLDIIILEENLITYGTILILIIIMLMITLLYGCGLLTSYAFKYLHQRTKMPIISRFFGIIIAIYWRDHSPPHFHAKYGNEQVTVEIKSGKIAGNISKRALSLVQEWRELHKGELLIGNWLNKINPLIKLNHWSKK